MTAGFTSPWGSGAIVSDGIIPQGSSCAQLGAVINMRVLRAIFGVLCFGVGVACVMGALNSLVHPDYFASSMDVAFPSMFGAMFLLGSYLLLRRRPST